MSHICYKDNTVDHAVLTQLFIVQTGNDKLVDWPTHWARSQTDAW